MSTILLTIYMFVGFVVFAIPFFFIDFLSLTTINKVLMVVLMLFVAFLWPLIFALVLVQNADQLTKENFDFVVTKIEEMIGKK